jgi:hypothetical protein
VSDKLEDDIRRGQKAADLLNHELIAEARAHIEAELWRKFQELSPSDKAGLEMVKGMQYLHGKYFAFFQQAITNGKLASINLEAKKKSLRERVFG